MGKYTFHYINAMSVTTSSFTVWETFHSHHFSSILFHLLYVSTWVNTLVTLSLLLILDLWSLFHYLLLHLPRFAMLFAIFFKYSIKIHRLFTMRNAASCRILQYNPTVVLHIKKTHSFLTLTVVLNSNIIYVNYIN